MLANAPSSFELRGSPLRPTGEDHKNTSTLRPVPSNFNADCLSEQVNRSDDGASPDQMRIRPKFTTHQHNSCPPARPRPPSLPLPLVLAGFQVLASSVAPAYSRLGTPRLAHALCARGACNTSLGRLFLLRRPPLERGLDGLDAFRL